jgi:hypothetical protein
MGFLLAFTVRLATLADLDGIARVERETWAARAAPTTELQRRLIEPGFETIVVELDSEVVAFSQGIRLSVDALAAKTSWDDLVATPPEPRGQILYGINLSARTGSATSGAGRVALDSLLALVVYRQLAMFVAGGRLPGFKAWALACAPATYARLHVSDKKIYHIDSEGAIRYVGSRSESDLFERLASPTTWVVLDERQCLRIRMKCVPLDPFLKMLSAAKCCGLGVELVGILPDYYSDPESLNNGILYAWTNPFLVEDRKRALQDLSVRVSLARSLEPV